MYFGLAAALAAWYNFNGGTKRRKFDLWDIKCEGEAVELNNNAGQATYADKRQKYYLESNYDWVKNFIDEHTSWTEEDVLVRAENMADIYYHKILERN